MRGGCTIARSRPTAARRRAAPRTAAAAAVSAFLAWIGSPCLRHCVHGAPIGGGGGGGGSTQGQLLSAGGWLRRLPSDGHIPSEGTPPVPRSSSSSAIGSQWVQTPRHGDPIDYSSSSSVSPRARTARRSYDGDGGDHSHSINGSMNSRQLLIRPGDSEGAGAEVAHAGAAVRRRLAYQY
jgi:hypothetical protein